MAARPVPAVPRARAGTASRRLLPRDRRRHPGGHAFVFTSERDNTHLAWLWLAILPEHRRRGYGTALFERLVEEVRARAAPASAPTAGSPSGRWASRPGTAWSGSRRRSCGASTWPSSSPAACSSCTTRRATAAADYELVRITGRTPAELVDAMVELVPAINDAPTDDLDIEDEVFSPERLARLRGRGPGPRATGSTGWSPGTGRPASSAATPSSPWRRQRPELADQHDTAVAQAHRGHRLGLLLKAGMLLLAGRGRAAGRRPSTRGTPSRTTT